MPTWGRFVCHVHCLVHDGVVRSSPCGPTTKTSDEISIICLFWFILQANPLFFVLSCGIRVASMSSVDSIPYSKWCSHIPLWILILLDHRVCHLNSISNRCVSLRDDPIILPIRKINSKLFLNGVHFIRPKLPLFFPPSHPFLQGIRCLNQVSILFM